MHNYCSWPSLSTERMQQQNPCQCEMRSLTIAELAANADMVTQSMLDQMDRETDGAGNRVACWQNR